MSTSDETPELEFPVGDELAQPEAPPPAPVPMPEPPRVNTNFPQRPPMPPPRVNTNFPQRVPPGLERPPLVNTRPPLPVPPPPPGIENGDLEELRVPEPPLREPVVNTTAPQDFLIEPDFAPESDEPPGS